MDEMADEKENETSTNSSTVNFAERSWKNDFTLIVEDTRFCVAKNILALASPVFDRMFESDFKERTTDELELPGKKADDVKEFLLAIYPNTAFPMSRENALKVLPLAEEYQVLNLKQRCEESLMGSIDVFTAIDELYRLIKESHLYSLKELQKRCVSFVCEKPTDEIKRANREIVLPREPLSYILQNLNERLVSNLKDLKSANVLLNEQLETYKTWKNYFSKATRKSMFPKLDSDLVWKRRTVIFTMDTEKRKPLEEKVSLWNTEMEMNIVFYSDRWYDGIQSTLKNINKNQIECIWEIQFAVVNKLPANDHLSFKYRVVFKEGEQFADWKLVGLSDIDDKSKGFVDDEGKVQLEVNLFMSEPKSLKALNL
ncbi:uncharacterized protein LOC123542271 [Mercenaria mercenaria]|uniref:uncharacterized protein LOC123542271 n=1 Tax=Mercenaria mercenaria TaxID=6596 RepID=UPI00234F4ADC|nr:uncharacterized protein LOC123542271 [Mercenaria mercenaria]